jgi:hypothetical protein
VLACCAFIFLIILRDGVCSVADGELLAGVPPIAKGEPLGGRFFPLLKRI